jgi:hypothetical protein
VSAAEVRRGTDGKLYPAAPLSRQQRNRVRWLAHQLVHRDGMSIRFAQREIAERLGIRRSRGSILADLRDYQCPDCTDVDT